MIKKSLLTIFSFLLVINAVVQLNAQQWQVYDCSVLPDAHTPAWNSSNTKEGVPTWTIQDDPDIPGNKYLEMLSPNVAAETAGMWKTDDFDPVPTAITVIARIKAAGDEATYEEVLDLDMRINPLREKLIIGSDNKLDLDRADVQKTPDRFDVSKWHTYRIAFDASTGAVDVYLDEDDTAVLSGTTSSSESSQYFRFGDGSNGKSYGALIDWIAYDVSGAYAPGEGAPIPEDLYVDKPVLGNIVFVSRPDKHDDINDVHPDSTQIDELVAAGYNVTLFYNTSLGTASEAQMDTLNNADVIILGRSCDSGVFGGSEPADKFAWNSVTTPILAMSPYFVRNNRMNWFNTNKCTHHDEAGAILNATIEEPSDVVFDGLTLTDGQLPWAVGPLDVLEIKEAGNAELLATSAVDSVVLYARFDPWVEYYPGAGDRPAGYRTLLGNGNDNTADPNTGQKIFNYKNFTEESKQVYYKEIERLISLPAVPEPPPQGNIVFVSRPDKHDDINNVHPDSTQIDELVAAGYNVTLFYNRTLGTASEAQMDTLNNADVIILGRSCDSGVFGGSEPADKFAWNSVTTPILAMSPYFVRSNRMNWFPTTSCTHHDEAGAILNATIEEPGDYVFSDLPLTDDQLPWAVGPLDVLQIKEVGNGELLASSAVDSVVLYARFDPWVEYYSGAGDRPAGYRTLLGNGNDNTADPNTGQKIFNYKNFTEESKQVYFKEIARLISLPKVSKPKAEGNIVFVSRPDKHDDINNVHPDSSHIDELVAAGYNVTLFYNRTLGTASEAQMDTLNNADVIILGRSCDSGVFGGNDPADKVAWNSVTKPILALSPYFVRNSRMNWFNTGSCKHYDDAGVVLKAIVEEPRDYVFSGLTLTDDSLAWAVGPYDVLVTKEAGNGELLARSAVDTNVLFVRFDPWVEFYAGAGDQAAGYRTMLGNGNDNSADPNTGQKIYNYNNFTIESKQVYLAEVARMVKLGTVERPTAVEDERHDIPISYELYQNYPNPFNPTTTIEFTLAKFGRTTLTIYNVMGQVVETLVDREMTRGIHRITFRADRYTSGIYFYKLKSGDHVEVKKMMLLK